MQTKPRNGNGGLLWQNGEASFKTIARDFVIIARACESKRTEQCSSLVHEVWNNTFSFSWSLVIPYCPVGHTHFRYHIRPFPFHAGRCKLQQMHRPCGKFRHWETFLKAWLVPNIPIHTWIQWMNYNMCGQWAKRRGTWFKLVENQQFRDSLYEVNHNKKGQTVWLFGLGTREQLNQYEMSYRGEITMTTTLLIWQYWYTVKIHRI